jgi:cellulose synthase/poly-beta-1,6-N-acetylglucosamine synthase-like glycosyltransferase
MALCARRELQIARVCFATTIVLMVGLITFLGKEAYQAYLAGDQARLTTVGWLSFASFFMMYGNFLYQSCIMGFFRRMLTHKAPDADALLALHDREFPSLSVLIPAYKEEPDIMWQTMMAAALCEYGEKQVVLLIDDPFAPKTLEDRLKLEAARDLPVRLQQLFDAPAQAFAAEWMGFCQRRTAGRLAMAEERARLVALYERAAQWGEDATAQFLAGREPSNLPHCERFFHETIMQRWSAHHRAAAQQLAEASLLDERLLARHFARLSRLFAVRFSSFERKKYAELSHEPNKAMNLNGYLRVMGRSWREEERDGVWHLQEVPTSEANFFPPASEYLMILDADSLVLREYALSLLHRLQQPEYDRIGVMQCYPSCYPGIPMGIERMAAASIDLLFRINQGHEALGGPSWMGANALVRRQALDDIAQEAVSDGKPSTIYIQDRTVIEDTETTVALLHKDWRVYQYPERLAFFSSPPDFGSLLIQRRRWANGGILLLPSLMRYLARRPVSMAWLRELFVRVDYMIWGPVGVIIGLVMASVHFGDLLMSPWLMLSPLPCLVLQLRTLRQEGYRYSDALRLSAFGVMLGPVIMGGVLKSIQQAITGRKIPFARTPKITTRTAAPALYAFFELVLPLVMLALAWRYAQAESWAQAVFTLFYAAAGVYALVYFMGVRATLEDLLSGIRGRWRALFHRAEVLPFSARETLPPGQEVRYGTGE